MSTLKSNSIQPTTTGNNLIFRTGAGDVERMRIDTSGNVGIGIAGPTEKLHVYGGSLRADRVDNGTSAILAGPSSNLQIKHYTGNLNVTLYNSSTQGFVFSTFDGSETERVRINGDGYLGIGTASPAVALDVNGEARSSTSTTSASNAKTLTTKDYVDSYLKAGAVTVTTPAEGVANNYTIDVSDLVPGKLYIYAARVSTLGAGNAGNSTFTAVTTSGEICGFGTSTVQHGTTPTNIATTYPPIQGISNGANIAGSGSCIATSNNRVYAWHYVSVIRYA